MARSTCSGPARACWTLDPTPLVADEVGNVTRGPFVPPIKLDCTLKFARKVEQKVTSRRLGAPPAEEETAVTEYRIYEVSGPKISSRLTLRPRRTPTGQSAA
jgi:hypothetical protein